MARQLIRPLVQPRLPNTHGIAQNLGGGAYLLTSGPPAAVVLAELAVTRTLVALEGWTAWVAGDTLHVLDNGNEFEFTWAELQACDFTGGDPGPPNPPPAMIFDLKEALTAVGVDCG